jgi:hypothetical protein
MKILILGAALAAVLAFSARNSEEAGATTALEPTFVASCHRDFPRTADYLACLKGPRGHPPVMAVVHRVRLLEPELDQVDALLRFLGGYPGLATFGDQHSDVVNAEPRVLDTPAESHTLREGPTAVDPHVGRVEHRFGGWVAPIRFIQTTSVGASIDCLISMVGAQGLEPWTR